MRRTELAYTVVLPLDEDALAHLALETAQGAGGVEAEQSLLSVRQLRLDVLPERQEVVLLLADEGPHEEHEDDGPLPLGGPVGPRGVPQPALEHQRRARGRLGCHRPFHREEVVGGDLAQVRPGEDAGAAVGLGDILKVPHDVEAEGEVADRRLDGHLVRVQLHGHVARARDVGAVAVNEGVLAQEPGNYLVDHGVVEEVEELVTLVDDYGV